MSFSHNSAVIFDPAPYYGHHEADIGIMKMFGGFGPNFFGEYRKIWPKKEVIIIAFLFCYFISHKLFYYYLKKKKKGERETRDVI